MKVIRGIDKKDEHGCLEKRVRDNFKRSQLHQQDLLKVTIVKAVFMEIVDVLTTLSGFLPFTYDISKLLCVSIGNGVESKAKLHVGESEIVVCFLFLLIHSLFETLVSLPWNVYHDFVVEEKWAPLISLSSRHGFNKKTVKLFFKDLVKSFFIELIMGGVIYSILILILRVMIGLGS